MFVDDDVLCDNRGAVSPGALGLAPPDPPLDRSSLLLGVRRSGKLTGAPQILALTVDRDEDFVQKPRISESTLTSLHPPGVIKAELPAPLPNSFVRHDDAAFGQQILDIPEAQAVSVIQPDGVADDFRRKAMPKVAGSSNVHPGIVPRGELT